MNEGKRFSLQKKYLHILKQRIYFCNLITIMINNKNKRGNYFPLLMQY